MTFLLPTGSGAPKLPAAFGKYTLLRRIAKGGMAELYLAVHRSMAGFEKLVVIKRILPLLNAESEFIGMLIHEARIAATLSHPNIVQIYDVGEIDGTFYIAMEHVPGEDLRAIQRQLAATRSRLPLEHAISIAVGLCSGLAYAHDKRDLAGQPLHIVHRDISPHNVIVTFSGDVKLIDFGVAKSRLRLGDHTRSGNLKGKISYMSPEQAVGQPIDHRSDVFAVGTTLYELTTGRRPFVGKTDFDTLRLVGAATFERPSRITPGYPPELEAIVLRAMAHDPRNRYQNARQLERDLAAFAHGARLPTSQVALADFMHDLFGDRLREQEELLAKAKALADSTLGERPPLASLPHSRSVPPGAMMFTPMARPRPARASLGALFRVPLAVALGSLIFLLVVTPRAAWQDVAAKGTWFSMDEPMGSAAPHLVVDERPTVAVGRLTVQASGRGCRIVVDQTSVGQAPIYELDLPAGAHAVQCAPTQGKVLTLNVRVDPGETMQVGFVVP
jgi:serine/threonine-protein kinase